MATAHANGLSIEYQERGQGEPLLLIGGLRSQLTGWPTPFLDRLADRGHRVIVFDQRDVGLSTRFDGAAIPNTLWVALCALAGIDVDLPYTLHDMADDIAGLLVALSIERAHVVGVSLGGLLAQLLAVHHPERLASMTLVSTHPGDRRFVLRIDPRAALVFLAPTTKDRDGYVARAVRYARIIADASEFDESELRARVLKSYERGFARGSDKRQSAALLALGSLRPLLGSVRVPTLVLHGTRDRVIPLAGGRAVAAAIPGAELAIIHGMGHYLGPAYLPQLVDAIAQHARRASAARAAGLTPQR
jgi:pimeloyl-ACP methyl ester carboxylesterase